MSEQLNDSVPHEAVIELVRRCHSDARIDVRSRSGRRDIVREHLDRIADDYGIDGSLLGKATATFVMERAIDPAWFVDADNDAGPNARRRRASRGVTESGGLDFSSMTYACTLEADGFTHEIGVMMSGMPDTWEVIEHVIPQPAGEDADYWQRSQYPTLERAWDAYVELCNVRSPSRAPSM